MKILSLFSVLWIYFAATGLLEAQVNAEQFQPVSSCGERPNSKLVFVSSLDAHAPDGLVRALAVAGPKIVVFRVGGTITLEKDIQINTPYTTIAGESAPAPGIAFVGASLRIRTHDVCIRHIIVRAGLSSNSARNEDRDSIAIGGNPEKFGPIRAIVLENLTVEWGIDENIGIFGRATSDVQIRSTLIANSLSHAGHPKGEHSKGMLIGSGARAIMIVDSVFANNRERNPRISPDTQVTLIRNVVSNPGFSSTEAFLNCSGSPPNVTLYDNYFVKGPETSNDTEQYTFRDEISRELLAIRDPCVTRLFDWQGDVAEKLKHPDLKLRLKTVGARPFERDDYSSQTIAGILNGTGHIIDVPPSLYHASPPLESMIGGSHTEELLGAAVNENQVSRILCLARLKLGSLPSAACNEGNHFTIRE